MKNFMNWLKSLFQPKSAEVLAQLELEEAKRQFLLYKASEEQAKHLSKYYTEKINRLEAYLKGDSNDKG
jgi:hypothetical protein